MKVGGRCVLGEMFPQKRGSPAALEGAAEAATQLGTEIQFNAATKCLVERLSCIAYGVPRGRRSLTAYPKRLENPQYAEASRLFAPEATSSGRPHVEGEESCESSATTPASPIAIDLPSSRRSLCVNFPPAVRSFKRNFPSSKRSLCVNFSSSARSFSHNFSLTARSCRLA